jgi:neutral ceramidase
MSRLLLGVPLALAGVLIARAEPPGPAFQVESNLRAAVTRIDITPPAGTKVVGHVREVDGVRDPLRAAVLLLDDGTTKAALVTFDLLNVPAEMLGSVREAVGAATGTPPGNIMVAVSHNHSGPGWAQNPGWARKVVADLGAATGKASQAMRPVSVGYGEGRIDFNVQRRKVIGGRAVVRLNPDGPCDHRVKVLRFDDGASADPVAVLMHAVCHPCVFTWGDK